MNDEIINKTRDADKIQIITDFDGVLVYICHKWCEKAFKNGLIPNPTSPKEVLERDEFMLTDWLKIEGDANTKAFNDLYFEDQGHFYNGGHASKLCLSFIGMLAGGTATLECVSHVKEGIDNGPKIKLFNYLFDGMLDKAKLHLLPINESKSDYVLKHFPDFEVFADDRLDIVADLIKKLPDKKSNERRKSFVLPSLGYNDYNRYDLMNFNKQDEHALKDKLNSRKDKSSIMFVSPL